MTFCFKHLIHKSFKNSFLKNIKNTCICHTFQNFTSKLLFYNSHHFRALNYTINTIIITIVQFTSRL